ncbi:MAG: AAA family ATPase [Pseudomonadota bacterium]
MLKISRAAATPPSSLTNDGAKIARTQLAEFFSELPSYRATRRAPIERERIYGVDIVAQLEAEFNAKCAYCEIAIGGLSGMIDHYRPLRDAGQRLGDSTGSIEHYGWFAYEWRNFFLSCKDCNAAKLNLFPVTGPRASVLCTWEEANRDERNRIVNPCEDVPYAHFRITIEGVLEGATSRGRRTVDVFQLNRTRLVAARSRKLQTLVTHLQALRQSGASSEAADRLQGELHISSTHAGCADIFLRLVLRSLAKNRGLRQNNSEDIVQSLQELVPTVSQDDLAEALPKYRPEIDLLPVRGPTALRIRPKRVAKMASFITRISIVNFKGIESLTLEMNTTLDALGRPPCLMLLGENATGKSTVLQAVALCLADPDLRDRLGLQPQDFLSRESKGWRSTSTRDCHITVDFANGMRSELRIDALKRRFDGYGMSEAIVLGFGARRFHSDARSRVTVTDYLRTLFDSSKPLVNPYTWLGQLHQDEFNAVARALREILVLDMQDEIFRDNQGHVRIRAHGRESPLTETSEGYKSFFAMVANIMRAMVDLWGNLEQARGIVLIDEIETHLHPRWKALVTGALRTAFPNVQFIATTHDPLCLRGMDTGEVHVLYHADDGTVQQLHDLPDVKNLRADQLLTSDFFGLASTADLSFEAHLDQLASSQSGVRAGTKSPGTTSAIDIVIGDTPFEQIVSEARRRFLDEFESVALPERAAYREQHVQDIVNALRNLRQRK